MAVLLRNPVKKKFSYFSQVKHFLKKEISNRVTENGSVTEKSNLKLNGHLTEKEVQAVSY